MNLQEAVNVLERHNEWRRNDSVPNNIVMVEPKELGLAIDLIVNHYNEQKEYSVKKMQDFESDFYWIPEDKVDKFNDECAILRGMEYSDNPELFCEFDAEFGMFATGGCADLVPDVFDNKNVQFL